ncbi:MAG TPA: cupin domain-containing protein [Methylomirabilota bacterium]|nr:cupin domain-containing protein [Methylomirabilota bacterium]
MAEMKIVYLADTEVVTFGADATYRPILGDAEGGFPIRTGIQTSQPGYEAPLHSHPYTEILHVLEGRAEAWLEGQEAHPTPLGPGDTIAIPPDTRHAFRVVGDTPMRLLGTHLSPRRIVSYADGSETDARGYRVGDA